MTIALRRELADTSEAEGQPSSDTSAPDAAPSVGRIIDLSHTSPKDSRRTSRLSKIALRAGGPLLILVIWQLAYSLGLLNKLIFASPGTVFASLWDLATTDNQLGTRTRGVAPSRRARAAPGDERRHLAGPGHGALAHCRAGLRFHPPNAAHDPLHRPRAAVHRLVRPGGGAQDPPGCSGVCLPELPQYVLGRAQRRSEAFRSRSGSWA